MNTQFIECCEMTGYPASDVYLLDVLHFWELLGCLNTILTICILESHWLSFRYCKLIGEAIKINNSAVPCIGFCSWGCLPPEVTAMFFPQ